jgi:hypothetical protein
MIKPIGGFEDLSASLSMGGVAITSVFILMGGNNRWKGHRMPSTQNEKCGRSASRHGDPSTQPTTEQLTTYLTNKYIRTKVQHFPRSIIITHIFRTKIGEVESVGEVKLNMDFTTQLSDTLLCITL